MPTIDVYSFIYQFLDLAISHYWCQKSVVLFTMMHLNLGLGDIIMHVYQGGRILRYQQSWSSGNNCAVYRP